MHRRMFKKQRKDSRCSREARQWQGQGHVAPKVADNQGKTSYVLGRLFRTTKIPEERGSSQMNTGGRPRQRKPSR